MTPNQKRYLKSLEDRKKVKKVLGTPVEGRVLRLKRSIQTYIKKKEKWPGHVYLIQAEELNYIKIGYSRDLKECLRQLQKAHWVGLVILKKIRGDIGLKYWLHDKFSKYCLRGEWFKLEGLLEGFIQSLNPSRITVETFCKSL